MRENAVPGGTTIAGAVPEQAVSPAAIRGGVVDTMVWLCARSAHALLALGLRLVMARVRGRSLGDSAGRHQGDDFPAVRDAICGSADRPGGRRLSLQLCRVCAA